MNTEEKSMENNIGRSEATKMDKSDIELLILTFILAFLLGLMSGMVYVNHNPEEFGLCRIETEAKR